VTRASTEVLSTAHDAASGGDTASPRTRHTRSVQTIAAVLEASDSPAFSLAESAAVLVAFSATDAPALAITDSGQVVVAITAADNPSLTVTDTLSGIAVGLSRADDSTISLEESTAIFVVLSAADAAALGPSEGPRRPLSVWARTPSWSRSRTRARLRRWWCPGRCGRGRVRVAPGVATLPSQPWFRYQGHGSAGLVVRVPGLGPSPEIG
jgi:hypothetical protein